MSGRSGAKPFRERIVPIKILGHWEVTRVHIRGGYLFIDIPAKLIALVETDHPGVGVRFGYQLLWRRCLSGWAG
jgi:hypothetical protein